MLSSGRSTHWIVRSVIRFSYSAVFIIAIILCVAARGYAQNADLVVAPVDPGNRVSLTRHHPAWAVAQNDLGVVPPDSILGKFEFVLARSPRQQQAFEQFLREQQDPASPNYHHWLTPLEVGERFGASQHDTDAIANWLQAQNLRVDAIANSRGRIQFSGPAAALANAFGAEMHYYLVDGQQRFSIAAEPQIPAALARIIKSIGGLYTINVRPMHGSTVVRVPARAVSRNSQIGAGPDITLSGGAHFLFPGDFAAIYDINTGAINGAGQTIAVIGESRVYDQDITNFESLAGLTPQTPTPMVIIPPGGVDPGPPDTSPPASGTAPGVQGEATLDVTRTISIAPGATIDLVVSSNMNGGGGIATASEYVVDTNPVFTYIMGISFGACESETGPSGVDFWDSLFSQAAAEGISVFVSSGDSGAAGCDISFETPPSSQSLSINYICASSYATCVGGTEFADTSNPTQYWSTTNSANYESALGYIPEGAWNEPDNGSGEPLVAASGGGVSAYIPTPAWQTGTGVPGAQGRYTPDVAFTASGHDGYFACFAAGGVSCTVENGGFQFLVFYGTSASAQDMAGITALLDQNAGAPQGQLNQNLYRLAATPSNNVFHDVTVATSAVSTCIVTTPSMCNNSTPSATSQTGGLSGYLVGTGYDEITGLGSIDVAKLLANWVTPSTTTLVSSLNPSIGGQPVTFTATVVSVTNGTPSGTVTFLNQGVSFGTGTLNGGVGTLTTSSLPVGSDSITASYGGDANFSVSASMALSQIVNLAGFAPDLTDPTVLAGQSVQINLTAYEASGYNLPFTLSCVGLPSKATCLFNQNPVTPGPPPSGTVIQLTIGTASSELPGGPSGRGPRPWGALGIFAALAALLMTGMAPREYAPNRRLALGTWIAVVVLATVLTACGSSTSSTPVYTGTPKGTSTFTVMGVSGSSTISTQVSVTVQ